VLTPTSRPGSAGRRKDASRLSVVMN